MSDKPRTLMDDWKAAQKTIASKPGGWMCTNCLAGNDDPDKCWFCLAASPAAAQRYAENLGNAKKY